MRTIIATSRQAALLVKYLETYLSKLERWLKEWKIAINASKSSAMLFAKAGRRIQNPRTVHLFGEPKVVIGHLEIVLSFRTFARYFVRTKKNRLNSLMVYGCRGGKAPGIRP
jgi:hypothetical protein